MRKLISTLVLVLAMPAWASNGHLEIERVWSDLGYGHILVSYENYTNRNIRHVEVRCTLVDGDRKVLSDTMLMQDIPGFATRDETMLIRLGGVKFTSAKCGATITYQD